MSLRAFVESKVDLAFDLIKDLKTEATLQSKGTTGYNPATSQVETNGGQSVQAFGVITNTENQILEGNIVDSDTMSIMFKKKDLPEGFRSFDLVIIDGAEHPVVYFKDDGYVVTFTISVR